LHPTHSPLSKAEKHFLNSFAWSCQVPKRVIHLAMNASVTQTLKYSDILINNDIYGEARIRWCDLLSWKCQTFVKFKHLLSACSQCTVSCCELNPFRTEDIFRKFRKMYYFP
jgi:hypothetical protein